MRILSTALHCFLVNFVGHFVEGLLNVVSGLGRHLHVKHLVSLGEQLGLLSRHRTLHKHVRFAPLAHILYLLNEIKLKSAKDLNNVLWGILVKILQPKIDRIE